MKILSIECSATPCSAAVTQDGKVLSFSYSNVKLTHSQALMPMISTVLKSAMLGIDDIDGFSVGIGPGSFTGIRIGISAVKGLAAKENKPCVGVSTLSALAENFKDFNGFLVAVMDARCNQVYNAVFSVKNGIISRLTEDRAISCDQLCKETEKLAENGEKVIIAGDGTEVFAPFVKDMQNVYSASHNGRFQNAVGVALASLKDFENSNTVTPDVLQPVYLRLPQAERELKSRGEDKK